MDCNVYMWQYLDLYNHAYIETEWNVLKQDSFLSQIVPDLNVDSYTQLSNNVVK